MPEINNLTTSVSDQLRRIKYSQELLDGVTVIKKAPVKLGDGSYYDGQWSEAGLRHGLGVQY